MKKSHVVLVCTLLIILQCKTSVLAYRSGSGTPSCHDDIAPDRKEPGSSPACTPPIMSDEMALQTLQEYIVRKIQGKWYLFISDEELRGNLDAAARWRMISLLVSAVQSKFPEQPDCLVARIPETAAEKKALLSGEYPKELIAAEARYVKGSDAEKAGTEWPEYHHHLLYTLTVY